MKTAIQIAPNRNRGYDATVYSVRFVRVSAFMRNLTGNPTSEEREPLHTVNAPSETAAHALAESWIASQPKAKRIPSRRALSEGDCETLEAQRNEESAHGRDY